MVPKLRLLELVCGLHICLLYISLCSLFLILLQRRRSDSLEKDGQTYEIQCFSLGHDL